jgi:hypothetical protein
VARENRVVRSPGADGREKVDLAGVERFKRAGQGAVGGQHADEYVGADTIFEVVVDGPQVEVEVVSFGDAEVPLDVFEVLVDGDGASE